MPPSRLPPRCDPIRFRVPGRCQILLASLAATSASCCASTSSLVPRFPRPRHFCTTCCLHSPHLLFPLYPFVSRSARPRVTHNRFPSSVTSLVPRLRVSPRPSSLFAFLVSPSSHFLLIHFLLSPFISHPFFSSFSARNLSFSPLVPHLEFIRFPCSETTLTII